MKALEEIKTGIEACRTYNFGMRYADKLAHKDADKLVAALEAVEAIANRVSQQAVDLYNKARVLPFDERAVAAAHAVEFEVIAADIHHAITEAIDA